MDRLSLDPGDEYASGLLSMSLMSYGSDFESSVNDSVSNLQSTLKDGSNVTVAAGDETVFELTDTDPVQNLAKELSVTGLGVKKQEELDRSTKELADAKKEYLEVLEVYKALEHVISSDSILPETTRDTARKLLLRVQLKKYMSSEPDRPGLLGLTENHLWSDCPHELPETDKKTVQRAVETQLSQTASELKQVSSKKQQIVNKIRGMAPDYKLFTPDCPGTESYHTERMAALRTELNIDLSSYYKTLNRLDSLLDSLVQLRTDKMNTECVQTLKGLEEKAQALNHNARLIDAQLLTEIYSEDENIVAALQRLQEELDLLCCETREELDDINALKIAYKNVEGVEFNSIVQEYVTLRTKISQIKSSMDFYKINSSEIYCRSHLSK